MVKWWDWREERTSAPGSTGKPREDTNRFWSTGGREEVAEERQWERPGHGRDRHMVVDTWAWPCRQCSRRRGCRYAWGTSEWSERWCTAGWAVAWLPSWCTRICERWSSGKEWVEMEAEWSVLEWSVSSRVVLGWSAVESAVVRSRWSLRRQRVRRGRREVAWRPKKK